MAETEYIQIEELDPAILYNAFALAKGFLAAKLDSDFDVDGFKEEFRHNGGILADNVADFPGTTTKAEAESTIEKLAHFFVLYTEIPSTPEQYSEEIIRTRPHGDLMFVSRPTTYRFQLLGSMNEALKEMGCDIRVR